MKHGSNDHGFIFDGLATEVHKHPDADARSFEFVHELRLVFSFEGSRHFDLDEV
jgi:hypothetical protein